MTEHDQHSPDTPTAPPRVVAGRYDGQDIEIPVPAEAVLAPIETLNFHPRNPRQGDVGAVIESIVENGFFTALTVGKDGVVLAGNHRLKAALQLGMKEIPILRVDTEAEDFLGLKILLSDNRTSDLATYDTDELVQILQDLQGVDSTLAGTGYDGNALDDLLQSLNEEAGNAEDEGDKEGEEEDGENGPGDQHPERAGNLQGRFLVPPMSILDTRQGYWRERKRQWLGLGLKSELGRGELETFRINDQTPVMYKLKNAMREQMGREPSWDEVVAEAKKRNMYSLPKASIFDPVLTELAYLWFCPPAGTVLDPFAGGSVRGVVAAALGLQYVGVELRVEQVGANREQWVELEPRLGGVNIRVSDEDGAGADSERLGTGERGGALPTPAWIHGDSCEIPTLIPDVQADLILACPPYADLEVYSDDPRDISNMEYDDFLRAYREIAKHAVAKLKDDRFVVFVVNDVRDKKGFYRNFLADTIRAIEDAGAHFYNEIVLVNNIGSAAIRAGRQFAAGRKVARVHQNVLVFFKGDPKTIPSNYPELAIPDLESMAEPDSDAVQEVADDPNIL